MGVLHTITEGGQIWAHRVRMFKQVLKTTLLLTIFIWLICFSYKMIQIPQILYIASWYNFEASFHQLSDKKINIDSSNWEKISHQHYSSPSIALTPKIISKYTDIYTKHLIEISQKNALYASSISLISLLFTMLFFFIRGNASKQKKHISGKKMKPAWMLTWQLKLTNKASSIKIDKLPLVKGTETQHILVTGGTGSGKTNCFNHILPQIRRKQQRAVIVDTTGILVERYYREGKDIILNPFHPQSVPWHPWIECSDVFDYDAIAESFIPHSYSEQEDYWRNSARTLFTALLQKSKHSENISEVTRWLLFEPLSKLCAYVSGTKAAAHLDINSEKTASSVRSVASSFLGCLEFIEDTKTPFSIRNWVTNKDDSWLFLCCNPLQRVSLNPLLSCWFSIATRSLMQTTPNFERRLWFVIDELPTLNKLRNLESFLSESRKYGGCALFALQSPSQLESIYGHDVSKTIIGNCATKIIFSEQDPEIASKISKAFGEREIKEYQEGISYGAHEMRDGVNLSQQIKHQPLVSPTSIQSLEKNQAFVKLPGNYPITKIKLTIVRNR